MRISIKSSLFTLLVLVVLCASCFAQSNFTASPAQAHVLKNLNTSISGVVNDPQDKVLQISYHKNNFNFKSESLVIPIQEDGSFQVDFDLEDATELNLSYEGQRMPLFLQKGDNLKLQFNGSDFLGSISCSGRGGKNNQYLFEASRKFTAYDKGYILYSITQKEATEYKQLIDKISNEKLAFYDNYSSSAKAKMTPAFKAYIVADYKYWRANQLLNYRTENPLLTGKAAPLDLPDSYYSFLLDLDYKNEVVLSNRNYCEFLEEFLKLKGEKSANEAALNYAQKIVSEPNMLIDEAGTFIKINEGDRVSILNPDQSEMNRAAIEKILPAFETNTLDYIKLQDGTKGWVRNLSTGVLVDEEVTQEAEGRIKKYAVCQMHNAKLISNPGEKGSGVIAALGYGEEVNYMHLKTSENFNYNHQGHQYYGKLVEVETKRGQKGWILDSFIKVMEKKVYEKENKGAYLYTLTDTSEARQYLDGEALYYTLAKALYWKIKFHKSNDIAREIAAYASHNDYKLFNDILRAEYDVEQLRAKSSDDYIETYAYSNLKSPVVKGVKIGLPFDKSAFVSATKAQAEKDYTDISNVLADRPSSSVSLKGKIEGGYLKKASLTLIYDHITYQEEKISLNVNQSGDYEFIKELKDPVLAMLECGNKTLSIYLFPGDNINIDFNANNFPNSVQFVGKSAALNTYLLEEYKLFGAQLQQVSTKSKHLNAKDFAAFAKDLNKKRTQSFDKYKRKNNINAQEELFIRSNIRYHYASMLFDYEDVQKFVQNKEEISLPKGFFPPIYDMPSSVEGVLPNLHYVAFIHQFLDHQTKLSENTNLNKIDLAKQYFNGEVLAYIEAKELAVLCQLGKAYENGPEILAFLNRNKYKQYNDVLRVVYNEHKPIQNGDFAPDFALQDIDGNEVKLSNLRGKVVYIDFWATWCRPCIKSMAYSQRLIEKYGQDEVVFLYVNMDEDPKPWQNYVASQGLEGVHLNAKSGKGYLSDIAKLYKVKQLPSFVIIDKNGKIAFNKAGSPGNKVVSNLIDGLLETPRF